MDDVGDDEMIDLDMDADEEGGEDLSELEELDRVSSGVDAAGESEDHVPNGYSSLVRLGRLWRKSTTTCPTTSCATKSR